MGSQKAVRRAITSLIHEQAELRQQAIDLEECIDTLRGMLPGSEDTVSIGAVVKDLTTAGVLSDDDDPDRIGKEPQITGRVNWEDVREMIPVQPDRGISRSHIERKCRWNGFGVG